jgi:hypothetical protein
LQTSSAPLQPGGFLLIATFRAVLFSKNLRLQLSIATFRAVLFSKDRPALRSSAAKVAFE